MIEGIPVFYTDRPGKMFVKERKVSMRDFYRFITKLHGDVLLDRYELARALVEKDVQRLKRHVNKYIKEESSKYDDCAIFMKHDTTVQELSNVNYLICYRVFIELCVREVKDEE
jgi:hypothetical protein